MDAAYVQVEGDFGKIDLVTHGKQCCTNSVMDGALGRNKTSKLSLVSVLLTHAIWNWWCCRHHLVFTKHVRFHSWFFKRSADDARRNTMVPTDIGIKYSMGGAKRVLWHGR